MDSNQDEETIIGSLAHEMVHVKQFARKELSILNGDYCAKWKGVKFGDDVEYEDDGDYCPDEQFDNDSEEYDSADSEGTDEEYDIEDTSLNDSTLEAIENAYLDLPSEDETLLCVSLLLTKARSLQKLTRNTSCILRFMRKKKLEYKLKSRFF